MRKFKFLPAMASATRPHHLDQDKAAGVPLYLPSLNNYGDQTRTDPGRRLSPAAVAIEREDGEEDDDFY